MGRKKNIPIDVPTSAAQEGQEGQGQPTGWAGVAEARWAPVKSIVARTSIPSKGTTSGGLPGLGKRSK